MKILISENGCNILELLSPDNIHRGLTFPQIQKGTGLIKQYVFRGISNLMKYELIEKNLEGGKWRYICTPKGKILYALLK